MSDWFGSLKETAGEHPKAGTVTHPTTPPDEGSLWLGAFAIGLEEGREGPVMVETPRRTDGLGDKNLPRTNLRLPKNIELYLATHTRGSINAVMVALMTFALQELESSQRKLVLKNIENDEDEPSEI